jgi:excisionase family DNA binding protein
MSEDNRLLTIEEAAEQLGMFTYTTKQWPREGRLPAKKTGKYWRIWPRDLLDFINNPPPLGSPRKPKAVLPNDPEPIAPATLQNPTARKTPEILARIQTLKAQGLPLGAIAQQLDRDGVPTLSGKGRWQKGTIGNLLAEAKEAPSHDRAHV